MNKVILIGNLGRDPELRLIPNGTAVCNFSIATTERWTKNGEKQERTEWHNIVSWDRTAEIAGEYLRKGSRVAIEGKLQTREWTDKSDVKRYTTEIIADRLELLGGGGDSVKRTTAPKAKPRARKPKQEDLSAYYPDGSPDGDDIPF